jgi:hypothetical protein
MAKYPAKGALVYFGSANPPTTLIGQMGDCEFDTGERDGLLDSTTHDTSNTREKLDNTLKQPPKLGGDILYDPADTVHEIVRSNQQVYAAGYCKVVLPDAGNAQWVFPARVMSFVVGLPVADKMSAKIAIEGMGAATFTA